MNGNRKNLADRGEQAAIGAAGIHVILGVNFEKADVGPRRQNFRAMGRLESGADGVQRDVTGLDAACSWRRGSFLKNQDFGRSRSSAVERAGPAAGQLDGRAGSLRHEFPAHCPGNRPRMCRRRSCRRPPRNRWFPSAPRRSIFPACPRHGQGRRGRPPARRPGKRREGCRGSGWLVLIWNSPAGTAAPSAPTYAEAGAALRERRKNRRRRKMAGARRAIAGFPM